MGEDFGEAARDRASYFFVSGSSETIVKVQVNITSSSLLACPAGGALATLQVISILLLPVAYVTCPLYSRSQSSVSGCWIVMRSNAAVTVVTPSPVCL